MTSVPVVSIVPQLPFKTFLQIEWFARIVPAQPVRARQRWVQLYHLGKAAGTARLRAIEMGSK